MAGNVRKAVAEGRSDAVPIFLGDIYLLFEKKIVQPDVAIIQVHMRNIVALFEKGKYSHACSYLQVSPPDDHGFCSLGTSVDIVRSAISNSKVIIGT